MAHGYVISSKSTQNAFCPPFYLASLKYRFAREKGLLGIGPYVFNDLDPIGAEDDSKEMWSSFDEFFAADREETSGGWMEVEIEKSR